MVNTEQMLAVIAIVIVTDPGFLFPEGCVSMWVHAIFVVFWYPCYTSWYRMSWETFHVLLHSAVIQTVLELTIPWRLPGLREGPWLTLQCLLCFLCLFRLSTWGQVLPFIFSSKSLVSDLFCISSYACALFFCLSYFMIPFTPAPPSLHLKP